MKELSKSELLRLLAMSQCEIRLKAEGFTQIAGIDEAGRGPLAGPVVAAACILPEGVIFENLNDSKQLTPEQRELLFDQITLCPGIAFGIGIIDVKTIDKVNILQATFLAMRKAVEALPIKPDYLLIDGNQLPHFDIPTESVVAGDGLSISIAAASILAKVTRDRIMADLDAKYPEYGFKNHKGYGTEEHLKAIHLYGPSKIHRVSFEPIKMWGCPVQLDLIQDIQQDVEKVGDGKAAEGKPKRGKGPSKKKPKHETQPKNPSESSDHRHVGDASMPEEIAVGAKGEREKPFQREEFDLIGDIEIRVQKEGAIEESGRE